MNVKICGLTRAEDALLAQQLGAWALGFIFYPKSKRYITPDAARNVLPHLPPEARTVGVFVNDITGAITAGEQLKLKGLQLHGDETPEECRAVRGGFGGMLIKAFRPEKPADLAPIARYKGIVDYILIDAPAASGQYGGTGHAGDWGLAVAAREYGIPVILAGGLGPDNIAAAMAAVSPAAADLASGVEAAPGIKDHDKLRALFGALKGMAA